MAHVGVGAVLEVADRPAQGVVGVGEAEGAPGVAAGSVEGDAVAVRAQPHVGDAVGARAVHRDEGVDPGTALPEEVLHAPEITHALLPDVADEEDVPGGPDVGLVHGPEHGQDGGQPPGVVRDPRREEGVSPLRDGDVGALGEDGIEVARQGQDLASPGAAPETDHVPLLVHPGGVHADFLEPGQEGSAPLLFHEGGRRDLREHPEVRHGLLVGGLDVVQCLSDRGVTHQGLDLALVVLGGRGHGTGGEEGRHGGEGTDGGGGAESRHGRKSWWSRRMGFPSRDNGTPTAPAGSSPGAHPAGEPGTQETRSVPPSIR